MESSQDSGMTLERGWLGSPAGQAAVLFAASGLLALVAMVDPQAHRGPLLLLLRWADARRPGW